MSNILYSIIGILIPFIGTSLGSALVFFMKKDSITDERKEAVVALCEHKGAAR